MKQGQEVIRKNQLILGFFSARVFPRCLKFQPETATNRGEKKRKKKKPHTSIVIKCVKYCRFFFINRGKIRLWFRY